LRSTGVGRFTPKFLKNRETQLFKKYLGIRFASDTKDALLITAEVPSSRSFSAVCKFQLHSAGVGSRRLSKFRLLAVAVKRHLLWHPKRDIKSGA